VTAMLLRRKRAAGFVRKHGSEIGNRATRESRDYGAPRLSARLSGPKFDALCKGQVATPVDGIGLAPHVRLPGVRARFTTAAGLFLAAEGAADFGSGGADVHIRNPAVASPRGQAPFGV